MERIHTVCVLGMGYVGLTLSLVLAEQGFQVTGVDTNPAIVAGLQRCQPHFHEKGMVAFLRRHMGKNLVVSASVPSQPQDVFVIAVSTPVDAVTKQPQMDHIISCARQIKEYIRPDSLVVLRSTIPVGTCRSVVLPILQETGKNCFLAFCPERTIEGNAIRELYELPQVIGGIDEHSIERAAELFSKVTPTIIRVSSLEAAEMIKLINNSYRDVIFGFANDIALSCESLGINAKEAIEASNLGYKRSSVPIPGFVGGSCLSKDPYILLASCSPFVPKIVKQARTTNEALPQEIAQRVISFVNPHVKHPDCENPPHCKPKIFLTGLAFKGKPATGDVRDSPSVELLKLLQNSGVLSVFAHDFVVSTEVIQSLGTSSVSLEEGCKDASCIIVANNHDSYADLDIGLLLAQTAKPCLFLDIWNQFDPRVIAKYSHIVYGGLGHAITTK